MMPSAPPQVRLSPNGRYALHIRTVVRPGGGWNHLDIDVREVDTGRVIAVTYRNYHDASILHFIEQDGRDYLIISEDYHGGYGCIDLATGQKAVFNPPKKAGKYEPFWCWAAPSTHDPVKRTLTIEGCYWACPYDLVTFDFSTPMSPPYKALHSEPAPWEPDEDDEEGDPVPGSPA